MLKVFQMFSFILKSKNRRNLYVSLTCCAIVILDIGSVVYGKCQDNNCGGNGVCKNNSCVCYDGWQGPQCQYCAGKVRLGGPTGTIHDGLGNYSISTKCSWLIDAPNSSIILHLEEFEIECGWDYVYIFDGDSVESPLLAVFSGLMYKNGYNIRRIPEVVANSGAALIHFYSDDASSMSGFNISYRLNACPSKVSGVDCSGNGVCSGRKCTCNSFWTGKACHSQQCPNSCGEAKGRGRCDGHGCKCNPGYKGNDCSQLAVNGYWETVSVSSLNLPGSASHGAVVWKDSMYLVAGESYGRGTMLYVYDFNGNVWKKPDTNSQSPSPRYGQSTVVYGDKIYMYGGVLGNLGSTSELWSYDIGAETWENINVKPSSCNDSYLMCGLLKLAGHTATVVTNIDNKKADKMVVIFGHSPSFGYVNIVQEFYFEEREWHIVNTTGYPVKGGYGHTASWDPLSTKIYVYGGVVSRSESSQELNRNLYSYDPNSKTWTLLTDAPSSRFLHSASFITPGLMLVFGGNTLNDPSNSFDGKCYSSELLAYDVTCDSWHVLEIPADLQSDLPRFGHSAVVFESSLYIYGGFAGQMLSDMLKYTPGQCSQFHTADVCLNVNIGAKCIWNVNTTRCENIQTMMPRIEQPASGESVKCPDLNRSSMRHRMLENTKRCSSFEDCSSCTHTTSDCVWCGNMCAYKECTSIETLSSVRSIDECPSASGLQCHLLLTCSACNKHPDCRYNTKCVPRHANNFRAFFIPGGQCRVCSELNSCMDCTMSECIWCHNEGRCVDKNAYTASFPYGQCREWTTVQNKCRSKETDEKSQCSFYSTCVQCRDDPACGWCDDGSRTGLGMCMPGGFAGPTFHTESLTSTTCLPDKWHFTTCPKCQCNGHAICKDNTTICEPCGNFAMGDHCEHCMKGYWGNPINGGKCIPCECNNHATHCHPETGKCFCTIKGLKGDHCDTCDSMNHYYKDDYNNGSCYYDLTVDYQFTFNLSKKEERHYTQINFKNSPIKSDIDADFAITCSAMAKMNVTMRKGISREEIPIFSGYNCTTFHYKFAKSEYNFGVKNNIPQTTFNVYVYDFQPPLWIQISFSQYPKLNLKQFFITLGTALII